MLLYILIMERRDKAVRSSLCVNYRHLIAGNEKAVTELTGTEMPLHRMC